MGCPAIQASAVVEEDAEHEPLGPLHRPESRALARQRPAGLRGVGGVLAPDLPEGRPDDEQEDARERHAEQHEVEERDLVAALREEARELGGGDGADLRADAAEVRGVGDREHQGRAITGQAAARLMLELGDDRDADREHHGGGGGVRDPEGDEGRREQQA